MSERAPKPPEVIKAQIAAFSAERVANFRDRQHLFNNLGRLAASGLHDESRTLEKREYHYGEVGSDKPGRWVEAGTEKVVATAEEYKNFLQDVNGQNYDPIKNRADLLVAYKDFAPIVNQIRNELKDPSLRHEHAAYLGGGLNSQVFKASKDGKEFAIRIPIGGHVKPEGIDINVAGAVLVKDTPHYEQIVAASYEDGVTVAELMPGQELGDLSLEQIKQMSDEQLSDLIDTLVVGDERGVKIDPNVGNYFYDQQEGFGIIDYHSSTGAGSDLSDQDLHQKILVTAAMLGQAGLHGEKADFESSDYYKRLLNFTKVHIDLLSRYRDLVAKKLPEDKVTQVVPEIEQKLHDMRDETEKYSDPRWVAQRMTEAKQTRLKREEELKNYKSSNGPAGWDKV